MSDVDRLVDLITARVRERLGGAGGRLPVVKPRDRGDCNDDEAPGSDCASCGSCVIRRPWSVRAMEGAGAMRIGAPAGIGAVPADLAKLIDHTLLKAEATRDEVVALCEDARKHRFASVCVNTTWVPVARAMLAGTDVMVCAVVGFPLGAMAPTANPANGPAKLMPICSRRDSARRGRNDVSPPSDTNSIEIACAPTARAANACPSSWTSTDTSTTPTQIRISDPVTFGRSPSSSTIRKNDRSIRTGNPKIRNLGPLRPARRGSIDNRFRRQPSSVP